MLASKGEMTKHFTLTNLDKLLHLKEFKHNSGRVIIFLKEAFSMGYDVSINHGMGNESLRLSMGDTLSCFETYLAMQGDNFSDPLVASIAEIVDGCHDMNSYLGNVNEKMNEIVKDVPADVSSAIAISEQCFDEHLIIHPLMKECAESFPLKNNSNIANALLVLMMFLNANVYRQIFVEKIYRPERFSVETGHNYQLVDHSSLPADTLASRICSYGGRDVYFPSFILSPKYGLLLHFAVLYPEQKLMPCFFSLLSPKPRSAPADTV
jgi:hypothetical protein